MSTTLNKSRNGGWPMVAALGIGLALVLTAVGTFWDLTGNDSGPKDSAGDYLPVAAIIAVAALVVFAIETRFTSTRSSLVFGVLAVLTVPVAWSGLPAVLAAGSVAAALGAPERSTAGYVGIGLSTLALVGAIAFAIAG